MKTIRLLLAVLVLVLLHGPMFGQVMQSTDWKAFFPEGLLDSQGNQVPIDVLNGKIIGLYFSAHWCPPCRNFSPKLVAFRDLHKDQFEVVFISSDHSEPEQFTYMKDLQMKWPTVKFHSNAANFVKATYAVKTIPTLIILSPKGQTITANGRKDVELKPDQCLKDWLNQIK